jgi:hypothetical protein
MEHNRNPAPRARAGLRIRSGLVAERSETNSPPTQFQAAWLARRFRLAPHLAAIVAELAFTAGVRA